jgi:hypothetical protein
MFSYRGEQPSLTTEYKLVAVDQTGASREKVATVHVPQRGWHKLDDFRRRFGYPSALCNLNGVTLYAVFIKQAKACLCSSDYPVAVWNLKSTEVPWEMATSPMVCFNDQLWLVGGSTADPGNMTNKIACYSPATGKWSEKTDAPWAPRMGHACLVKQKQVWVLGGLDANGNALRDVWSCDASGRWQRHADQAWPARCMFAATDFQDQIWVYGGVTEPFGDPLDDMWRSADGKSWQLYTATPRESDDRMIGKPIGCTLQVIRGELNLIGTFRKGKLDEPRQFILQQGQETWARNGIPLEQAWHRQGGTTFSLSSVEYKGLVFLRSLNYQTADNPTDLNVYVP